MPLRDYQVRTIQACREQYRAGKRSILIVLPTGAGKTRLASALLHSVVSRGGKALWLVHRKELITQARDALVAAGMRASIIAPWASYDEYCDVTAASLQTLVARGQRPRVDVVVVDEAHHTVAETYADVTEHYADKLRIGLTATPQRGDGVGLGNIYDSLVVGSTPRELTDKGYLVPCKVVGPTKRTKTLAEHPVDAYRALGQGRQCVVYAASVKHARDLALQFKAAGYPAACVDGEVDMQERDTTLRRFRDGHYRVLTNMHILTEGWDSPSTSCIILARQFGAEGIYLQSIGRGLRPAPGKRDCLVIDLCGAALVHGLPTDDRVYTLDGAGISTKTGLEPCTQCAACGMVFRAALFVDATCPSCGHVRKGKQDPAVRRQILAAIAEKDPDTARIEYLKKQVGMCRANGWKLGRALKMFQIKYRYWPNDAMKAAAGWYAGGR